MELIISKESIVAAGGMLSSPGGGELVQHLEVQAVGPGQIDPLLQMAASQLHRAPRAVVADSVGDRADAVEVQAAGAPDQLDQQPHALVAGLAEAVEHRGLWPVAGGEPAGLC